MLGANATVQAIKYSLIPFGPSGSGDQANLSGHVAVAASTILAMLLVAPPHARRLAIWCGWALLSGVCIAILLSRWHTPSQVLVPLFVCGAWAVAGYAVLSGAVARHLAPSAPGRAAAGPAGTSTLLTVGGTVVTVGILLSAWLGYPNWACRTLA